MYSNYICLEAIILVLLTHVGWYDHKHILMQCSRDKSRIVRSIIQKKFIPILERYRVSMPMDCPFHVQRDLLWWPETDDEAEQEDDELSFHWTCPFCGSTFLCAERLAIHWDESHRFDINQRDDSICLADFCDIMRCDVIIANKRKRRNRMRSEASPKIRKDFDNCDSNLMKRLETRCEQVIRQCTQGLLSNISLKDYRDIELDLIGSICSYLNCDRYLDDYSNENRNVPLTLCLVIGIIMIGGFCLCYYIVWMLFDSGYKSRAALMSRKPIEEETNRAINWAEEIKFKKDVSDFEEIIEERIPVSDRPKILITSPSTHRLIRSQPTYHFYHPNKQNQYSSIEEDSWESCVDVSNRTVAHPSSSSGTITATTAAIHSRPENASRASSHTTSQSNQSNPYNR